MPTTAVLIRLAILAVVAVVYAVRFVRRRHALRRLEALGVELAVAEVPQGFVGSEAGDRATLATFGSAGGNPTRPTEVRFFLYFPSRRDAERAARTAGTPELAASVQPPVMRGGDWLLLLSGTMVPSEGAIRHATTRLEAVAEAFGGEYDGWEAKVAE